MKEIKLNNGNVTVVDDEDYEWLNQWKWEYKYDKRCRTAYVERRAYINGKRTTVSMHRIIMGSPKGMQIDHIDHDGCNNQRTNLRICTTAQNQWNARIRQDNNSGYIGVWYDDRRKKWVAEIKANHKHYRLGNFDKAIDAVRAYNEAALKYHGQFATINQL